MAETSPNQPPPQTSMLRKLLGLLHDALIYGVSGVLSQLINFLLLPLYTQFLTPADYGVMAMLTIVGTVFEPLARLGITQSVFRFYNLAKTDDERASVMSTGLVSVIASTGLLLAIGLALAGPLTAWIVEDISATSLMRLTLLTSSISVINGIPQAALRADRRVKVTSIFNLAKLAVSLLVTIWLVVGRELGIAGVIWGTLIAELLACIGLFAVTFRNFPLRFARDLWRSMIAYGAPFVPHHLQAVLMDQFAVYIVGQRLGTEDAGLYNLAIRFAAPVSFAVGAIQQAWVAYKFHRLKHDENPADFFRTAITYYAAGVLYLWLGISLWGPELVRGMTPADFHGAIMLVPIVALIRAAQGAYFMMGTGMEVGGRTATYPLITLTGLVTVVGLSLALVPWFGAIGAASANAAGWLAMAAVAYLLAQRQYKIHYDWTAILAFAACASGAVAIGYWMQGREMHVRITLALLLSLSYPMICFAVLLRSPHERERMQILLSKLRTRRRAEA